ncbi:MAG: protein translocase subunit SecF [Gammaproteobacteria bacterium]|nr:protein translocase subunit SecF [Gammaproteobacteria bacterium]
MRLFSKTTEFDFVGKRWIALGFSLTLIVISIAAISVRGLNLGLDFTGGTLVEVGYGKSVELDDVRKRLTGSGFEDALVQYFGTSKDVLIRIAPHKELNSTNIGTRVMDALHSGGQDVNLRRVEFVGPQVGDELTEDGGLAVLYALIGILIYVTIRFEKRFSLGAVIALIHDVIITVGVFAVFQLQFDLTVLAAILAVIGYSLNDTIVVFDRVRENFRKMRKADAPMVMNVSINETLSRTINTSLTTLLVLIALFLLGGEIIHGFSTALIVGIVIGTYSSIYVAGTAVLALGVSRADLMPVVVKEGTEQEAEGREPRG